MDNQYCCSSSRIGNIWNNTKQVIEAGIVGAVAGAVGGRGAYASWTRSGIKGVHFAPVSTFQKKLIKAAAGGIVRGTAVSGGVELIKAFIK